MAELKTIKELAQELDCSYEAVRQHVKRYQRQLSDHVSYIGKSQYLDEWACDFIKSKRVESPITVRTVERHERITELEQENKNLLIKVATVQDELLKEKDKVQILLDEKREQIALLEAQNGDLRADNEKLGEKVADAVKTAEKAKTEAWHHYRVALEIYNALPWWKKRRRNAPEPPKEKE